MAKEETEQYIVTMKNTLDHKVGDLIELTKQKAFALVGKVELKPRQPKKKKVKKGDEQCQE